MSNLIEGIVESLNESGDLVTDIPNAALDKLSSNESVRVAVGPHETIGIHLSEHNEPDSTMIAVLGKSGNLEIGIVGMNMSEMLGIQIGQQVKVIWKIAR